MIRVFVSLLAALAVLGHAPAFGQPIKGEKRRTDGKEVLRQFAGAWTASCALNKAVWTPDAMTFKGTATSVLTARDRVAHFTGDFLPGKKRFTLTLTYHEADQEFSAVYFDGDRPISFHGTWNADAKTLSMNTWDLPPTSINTIKVQFLNADTLHVHMFLNDRTFKSYLQLNATLARQK